MSVSSRSGFWIAILPVLSVSILSAAGIRNHFVWGTAAFGILPFLFGAVAWLHPARVLRNRTRLRHQRNILLACLALLLSVPLTRWPLWVSIYSVHTQLEQVAAETIKQRQQEFDGYMEQNWGVCANVMGNFDRRLGFPERWCGVHKVMQVRVGEALTKETVLEFRTATGLKIVLRAQPNQRQWTIED